MAAEAFVFAGYRWDPARSALALDYRLSGGPTFTEELVFDFPTRELSAAGEAVLDRLFRLILLFAGVSYYKAFVPKLLRCEAFSLDPDTAAFVHRFYENGLSEFAFRNRIVLNGHFRVESAAAAGPAVPIPLDLPRRLLVPIGGGKDSLVTLECLRRAGREIVLFALGDAAPIRATIAASGLPAITVRRRLDPALFALNAAGAPNGHVPITGILSGIALAAAVLYGCEAVVMSNEHSASAPTLVADGIAINHQYSKSLDFEADLAACLARGISPNLSYFSLLRPLSEIEIARRFAHLPQYFGTFRSCNTAFRQIEAARGTAWCGHCPKCRFVFLALAPFVAKRDLVAIFGRDLLDDESQIDGFAALCGLAGDKPFECVGEVAESAAVMAHLARRPEWRDAAVPRGLDARFPVLGERDPGEYGRLLAARHPHRLPPSYREIVDACG